MDIRIRLNIFVSCQRRFPSPALRVFGITIIQHKDGPEYCQRRFPFPALRVSSVRMQLNIVSAIFHSRHYKPSASHSGESFTYRGLRT